MAPYTWLTAFLALAVHAVSAQVPQWGQCGGIGYNGSTQCAAGLTCVKQNDYYSQCLQSGPTQQPTTQLPTTTATTNTSPAPTGGSGTPLSSIPAGALTTLTNFGSNPTNIGMYVYKPSSLKANPGLIVALHYCGGTAQAYYSGYQFRQLADQRGFLLYGQAPNFSNCWDIVSTASKTHNGGSDALGIASAARFAISNWGVDPEKVFVVGTSSGAMMVNVLAGSYPDIFKAGAAFAGSALGCLTANTPQFPMDACQSGQKSLTAQQWGDMARSAYPGYTGKYPRLQFWHGTADPVLNYNNLAEEIKQWTNVHGISQTATSVSTNNPKTSWTKSVYGNGEVIGYSGQGAGHGLPESGTEAAAIDFFGL